MYFVPTWSIFAGPVTYGKLYSIQNSVCVRPSITTQPPTLPNITHRPHTPRVIIKFCILRYIATIFLKLLHR